MWKRFLAEFIGTFVIVLAPVALASTSKMPGGDPSLVAAALVSGLAVLAMIYALGPISAAHFNPAVSIGFAIAKRFPWKFVAPYCLSQLLGGIAASGLAYALFGTAAGAHVPADPSAIARNVGMESVLGFFLMLVIIAVATDRRVSSTAPAIAIGFTVVIGVLIGGPVTGGSMNPARSFGPALFVPGAISHYWVYLVGPCLGAIIAAILYEIVRFEPEHAKGAPNELLAALTAIEGNS